MKLTRNRILALKGTLLISASHRYPYSDDVTPYIQAGYLDTTGRITLKGARVVLQHVASCEIPWLAIEETQRVLTEIKIMFSDELTQKQAQIV